MIPLGLARESDVVLAFLKAEIDYSDSRQWIHQNLQALGLSRQELIDRADLCNDYHNAVRAQLLEYRGYLTRGSRGGLFIGFPSKVDWRRVELEPTDFGRLRYIANDAGWDSLSNRTRSPQVVADKVACQQVPEKFATKVAEIRETLSRGETLTELVAVEGEGNTLILIEGAHRITAYVGLNWQANIPAIIGRSALMPKWRWYEYRS